MLSHSILYNLVLFLSSLSQSVRVRGGLWAGGGWDGLGFWGEGAVSRRALHRSPRVAAVQQGAQVAEHGLAEDDENPGVHDGVERLETERQQVFLVIPYQVDCIDKPGNLRKRKRGMVTFGL